MLGFDRRIVIGIAVVVVALIAIGIYLYASQPPTVASTTEPAPAQQVK